MDLVYKMKTPWYLVSVHHSNTRLRGTVRGVTKAFRSMGPLIALLFSW